MHGRFLISIILEPWHRVTVGALTAFNVQKFTNYSYIEQALFEYCKGMALLETYPSLEGARKVCTGMGRRATTLPVET